MDPKPGTALQKLSEQAVRPGQRMRGPWLIVAALSMLALLISLAWHVKSAPAPPAISIASIEPLGVFDEDEAEMWQLNLSVGKGQTGANGSLRTYHKDLTVEARVGNGWVKVENPIGGCCLVPGKANRCRVCLKYTGSRLVKGRAAFLAEGLPRFVRTCLPATFWRWAGFVHYGPRPDWHDLTVELPFQPSAPRR